MNLPHAIGWSIFLAFVLCMLALDLLVLHRKPHTIHLREALLGALAPVAAAALMGAGIYFAYSRHFLDLGYAPAPRVAAYYPRTGADAALLYFTGYIVELSLSADNVLLFVLLMGFFMVPRELQHRVLFWGVLGALLMRGIMVLLGAALLEHFIWVIYLFGAFLLFSGVRLLFRGNQPADPSNHLAVRLIRRTFPFMDGFDGKRFFSRINGRRVATTLLLVLICIELADLVFALDSIPAVFGITRDTFLVFTSNVMAIIGLRSMYFLLAGFIDRFRFLRHGLAAVLGFVGIKMLLPGAGILITKLAGGPTRDWEIDPYLSLAIIIALLAAAVAASLLFPATQVHAQAPAAKPLPPESPRPGVHASA